MTSPYDDIFEAAEEERRRERLRTGQLRESDVRIIRQRGLITPDDPRTRVARDPLLRTLAPLGSALLRGATFGLLPVPELPTVYGEEETSGPSRAARILSLPVEIAGTLATGSLAPFSVLWAPMSLAGRLAASTAIRGLGRTAGSAVGRLIVSAARTGGEGAAYSLVTTLTQPDRFRRAREVYERTGSEWELAAYLAREAGIRGAEWAAWGVPLHVVASAIARRRVPPGQAAPRLVTPGSGERDEIPRQVTRAREPVRYKIVYQAPPPEWVTGPPPDKPAIADPMAYITPETAARVQPGLRSERLNPRQLGLNPRAIAQLRSEMAQQLGREPSLAEVRAEALKRNLPRVAQELGEEPESLFRRLMGEQGAVLLSPEGAMVSGPVAAGRRQKQIPVEAVGAALLYESRDFDTWSRLMRERGHPNPDRSLFEKSLKLHTKVTNRFIQHEITPLARVLEMYEAGAGGHAWYRGTYNTYKALIGDEYTRLLMFVLAATSGNNKVSGNLSLAIKLLNQYMLGQPFRGASRDVIRKLERYLAGEDPVAILGRKTGNFYLALTGDEQAVVVDRWIAKAVGKEDWRRVEDSEYDLIEEWVRRRAAELGVTPAVFQARIWTGIRALEGVADPAQSFESLLETHPHYREFLRVAVRRARNEPVLQDRPQLEQILRGDDWVIMTAVNPSATPTFKPKRSGLSDDPNTDLLLRLVENYGITADQIVPVRGTYAGAVEESFLIRGLSTRDAIRIAKGYGQSAILTPQGLVEVQGKPQLTLKWSGQVWWGEDAVRGGDYSTINTQRGPLSFHLVLTPVPPERLPAGQRGEINLTWAGGRFEGEPREVAEQVNQLTQQQRVRHILRTGSPPPPQPPVRGASLGEIVEKVEEFSSAMRLTLPLTHIRNTVSNTLAALIRPIEAEVAGRLRGVPGEGKAVVFGYAAAFPSAARRLVTALQHELTLAGAQANEARILEQQGKAMERLPAIGGPFGVRVRTPFRLLHFADEFMKELHRTATVHQLAYRQAVREKASDLEERIAELVASPTKEMLEAAERKAAEFTFTEDLGQFGRMLLQMRESVPGARLLFPFIKTPINVAKFFARRTPLGLATGVRVEGRRIVPREGGEFEEAAARAMVGSAIGGLMVWLAMQGKITGAGPDDPSKRRTLYASGWQPYSILVGDTYVSYRGMEPVGMFLAAAANIVEGASSDVDDKASRIIGLIGKSLADATFVNQLSGILNTLERPETMLGRYVTEQLTSAAIPAAVAGVARTLDPTVRQPRNLVERAMTRVPFLREQVPARLDVYGQPARVGGIPLLTPPMSRVTEDPALRELVRLGLAVPYSREEGVQAIKGPMYRRLLNDIVTSASYAHLDDEARRRLLKRVLDRISRKKVVVRQ